MHWAKIDIARWCDNRSCMKHYSCGRFIPLAVTTQQNYELEYSLIVPKFLTSESMQHLQREFPHINFCLEEIAFTEIPIPQDQLLVIGKRGQEEL